MFHSLIGMLDDGRTQRVETPLAIKLLTIDAHGGFL